MPDFEFVMSYPCFFLLNESKSPTTVIIHNERCLCLFTHEDIVKDFYSDKFGPNARNDFQVEAMDNSNALIGTIDKYSEGLAFYGVKHLAIDPTPTKQTLMVDIEGFVKEIASQD